MAKIFCLPRKSPRTFAKQLVCCWFMFIFTYCRISAGFSYFWPTFYCFSLTCTNGAFLHAVPRNTQQRNQWLLNIHGGIMRSALQLNKYFYDLFPQLKITRLIHWSTNFGLSSDDSVPTGCDCNLLARWKFSSVKTNVYVRVVVDRVENIEILFWFTLQKADHDKNDIFGMQTFLLQTSDSSEHSPPKAMHPISILDHLQQH